MDVQQEPDAEPQNITFEDLGIKKGPQLADTPLGKVFSCQIIIPRTELDIQNKCIAMRYTHLLQWTYVPKE